MHDHHFTLRTIAEGEWLLLDHRHDPGDARHTSAYVRQIGPRIVKVLWLAEIRLAPVYESATAVLDEARKIDATSRSSKPIPIVHQPPRRAG